MVHKIKEKESPLTDEQMDQMTLMRCAHCWHWHFDAEKGGIPADAMGECRRYPMDAFPIPSTNSLTGETTVQALAVPRTCRADFNCGEFTEAEEPPGFLPPHEGYVEYEGEEPVKQTDKKETMQ